LKSGRQLSMRKSLINRAGRCGDTRSEGAFIETEWRTRCPDRQIRDTFSCCSHFPITKHTNPNRQLGRFYRRVSIVIDCECLS
jgi:hypothetical protein